jgi:hypothetical protein
VLVLVVEARWPWHARPEYEYEYEYRFAEYEYEILCATRRLSDVVDQRRLTPATQLVLILEARWPWHVRPEYEYEYRFAEYEHETLCATRRLSEVEDQRAARVQRRGRGGSQRTRVLRVSLRPLRGGPIFRWPC